MKSKFPKRKALSLKNCHIFFASIKKRHLKMLLTLQISSAFFTHFLPGAKNRLGTCPLAISCPLALSLFSRSLCVDRQSNTQELDTRNLSPRSLPSPHTKDTRILTVSLHLAAFQQSALLASNDSLLHLILRLTKGRWRSAP